MRRSAAAAACAAAAAGAAPVPTKEIAPGVLMPFVSLGTGSGIIGKNVPSAVEAWIAADGRGIDAGHIYIWSTAGIGKGIAASGLPREELFITSKTPCAGDAAASDLDSDLKKLGTSYVDLLLIHTPGTAEKNCATWAAFAALLSAGKTKAIGVSNFDADQIDALRSCNNGSLPAPVVNQICFSVGLYPKVKSMLEYMAAHNGTLEAYSPLHKGKVLSIPEVVQIAQAHSVSTAQVALRYIVQHGATLATSAAKPDYIKEDLDLWSFALTDAEMATLDAVDGGLGTCT